MTQYKNVEHTKPLKSLFLFLSTLTVFVTILFFLHYFQIEPIIGITLPFIPTIIYFYLVKDKFIKYNNFKVSSKWLEIDNKRIEFENIESFKIYTTSNGYLKIYLKDNIILRFSSNDLFCDAGKFISMSKNLEINLLKYKNHSIKKRKHFSETKFTDYFIKILIIFVFAGIISTVIYRFITNKEMNTIDLIVISIILCGLWCGIIRTFKKYTD